MAVDEQIRLMPAEFSPLAVQAVTHGGAHTVVLSGELDIASGPELATMIRRFCAVPGTTRLTIDLGGLTFIDSSGIKAMLDAKRICAEYRHEFRLIQGPENVRRVFEITGLSDIFAFASD
jgi:anti-anti-sigma factor